MRKVFFLSVACLLCSVRCFAAPCWGTHMPRKHHVSIGAHSYSIFERDLEDNFGTVRSQQEFFNLCWGMFDWLSIDMKIGIGSIRQHPIGADELDYSTSFAGGYGYRVRLVQHNNFTIVFGFQHISVHPYSSETGNVRNRAILDDWQYSALASRVCGRVTPYAGVRWSRVDYIHQFDDDHKRKMSDRTQSIGAVCGMDIATGRKTRVNVEGQFFDGVSCAVGIMYAF